MNKILISFAHNHLNVVISEVDGRVRISIQVQLLFINISLNCNSDSFDFERIRIITKIFFLQPFKALVE